MDHDPAHRERLVKTYVGRQAAVLQRSARAAVDSSPGARTDPLARFHLLQDFRGLSTLLSQQLAEGADGIPGRSALSAFYVAAGLHQIIEDHLHRDVFVLQRAAARLESLPHAQTRLPARLATAMAGAASELRSCLPRERVLARWAEGLERLLETLGDAALDDRAEAHEEARRAWTTLREPLDRFPESLLDTVLRLPNSAYRFDQRPEDCRELVRRFAVRWPDRRRPILVVGLRTSGTYLAPLYVQLLRGTGYGAVDMLTVRPGQRWRRTEVARVRALFRRGALVLIVDDPPTYGTSVAQVANELQQRGAAPESIVPVLPLFGPAWSLPEVLRGYESVLLPWLEWAIHERLQPSCVHGALTEMLVGREVKGPDQRAIRVATVAHVEQVDYEAVGDHPAGRGHASADFSVEVIGAEGEKVVQPTRVQGLGLGCFEDHERAVASALEEYLPQLYRFEDGLCFMGRPPAEWRVDPSRWSGLESRIVSYVLDRRQRLPLEADFSLRVRDNYPVWELVADILGRALMGSLRSVVYPLTHVAGKRLVVARQPSVVDGSMAPSVWFVAPSSAPENAVKDHWGGGVICCDAAFDLASAAASFDAEELVYSEDGPDEPFSERLLEAYRTQRGEEIDAERWLLYQLLYNHTELAALSRSLGSLERARRTGRPLPEEAFEPADLARRFLATERALAAAHQRYFGGVYFADLAPGAAGPLCALDVDWVLESRWFDFPAITPAGALALRALILHGCRPVLATGRSVGEVRQRTRAYRLCGGVAEYGTVIYDGLSDRIHSQLGAAEEENLERLRGVLRRQPGVYLDHAFRYAIRAVRMSTAGERRGLSDETITAALAEADVEESVEVHYGGGQTDFAPTSLSKGTGLRALARALGEPADGVRPLAFAMGDAWADVPMLALAQMPFVPPNMGKGLRDELRVSLGATVVQDPHGAGLLQAVRSFLGHDPRRCPTCAPPRLSGRQKVVLTAFAGSDGPRRTRVRQAAALASSLGSVSFRRGD
jgi:hydroxymethylpyrimidine pyrophosphatase-like HAD family hydrolase